MRVLIAAICLAIGSALAPFSRTHAEESSSAAAVPTTVEYYYRVKWGSLKEFVELYDRNHKPLLDAMQKSGFVTSMKTEFPFTHLAGGQRWDVRVRITFRDAAAAINDPRWEAAWNSARKSMFKDLKKFEAEESRRFSLVEEHWDVIVSDYPG
jgi:hypothetical protein